MCDVRSNTHSGELVPMQSAAVAIFCCESMLQSTYNQSTYCLLKNSSKQLKYHDLLLQ